MVLRKKNLIFILLAFILLSLNKNHSFSQDKLKLRFKNIKIYNHTNSYELKNSNAIKEYLKQIFSENGELNHYFLEVIIKQYNVSVKKTNEDKILKFRENNFSRTYEHKLGLVINLKKQPNSQILRFKIIVKESKKEKEYLSISDKKSLNQELLKIIKKKTNRELRKKFLVKMGDFILPY